MTYPEVDHVGRSGAAIILTCETDASTPLKPGETKMGGLDAPLRGRLDVTTGSSVVDHGIARQNVLHAEQHYDDGGGFANMIAQLFEQLGETGGRQVVDLTGIKGNYDASIDLSLSEVIVMARAAGANIPAGVASP